MFITSMLRSFTKKPLILAGLLGFVIAILIWFYTGKVYSRVNIESGNEFYATAMMTTKARLLFSLVGGFMMAAVTVLIKYVINRAIMQK